MNSGLDLAHGEAVKGNRARGFVIRIGTEANGACHGRDGERIDEILEAIDTERAMNGDRCGRLWRAIHPGHGVSMWQVGLLWGLKRSGFQDADLRCGQCGCTSTGFDQESSARGVQEFSSFPMP
jgi:hypothetical protein